VAVLSGDSLGTSNDVVISGIGANEASEWIGLLSAWNYPFEIMDHREISRETFFKDGELRFAVLIITEPFSEIDLQTTSMIEAISQNYGMSLISTIENISANSRPVFGIEEIKGKKKLTPPRIDVVQWPGDLKKPGIRIDFGIKAGLTGIRRRGLGKLDLQKAFSRIVKNFRDSSIEVTKLSLVKNTDVLAVDRNGLPLAHSHQFGAATNYCFALSVTKLLGKFNEAHNLVRSAIDANSGYGMVTADLDRIMALRIDDPGSCVSGYQDTGAILDREKWNSLGDLFEKKGIRASIMYTPRWVDDGDPSFGDLYVEGKFEGVREPGRSRPSSKVKFISKKTGIIYDHNSEYQGIKDLLHRNLIDVQSHGLTHLLPDHEKWILADKKKRNKEWFHEYYDVVQNREIDSEKQTASMRQSKADIISLFGSHPVCISPSGHKQDLATDVNALNVGYLLFSSDYTSISKGNRKIRNSRIPAIFLFLKDPLPNILESGYPFIGVIHDMEITNRGIDALMDTLQRWIDLGIKKIISMEELAVLMCCKIESTFDLQKRTLKININLPEVIINSSALSNNYKNSNLSLSLVMPSPQSFNNTTEFPRQGRLPNKTRNEMQKTKKLDLKVQESSFLEIPIDSANRYSDEKTGRSARQ